MCENSGVEIAGDVESDLINAKEILTANLLEIEKLRLNIDQDLKMLVAGFSAPSVRRQSEVCNDEKAFASQAKSPQEPLLSLAAMRQLFQAHQMSYKVQLVLMTVLVSAWLVHLFYRCA